MQGEYVLGAAARAKALGLPKTAMAGALLFAAAADSQGYVEMSAKEMACWLHVSRDTAKRIVRDMVDFGLIQIVRPGRPYHPAVHYLYAIPIVRGSEADPCAR